MPIVNVGDVVAWADVPSGALVRADIGAFYVERGAWRYRVHSACASFWAREIAGHPERARNTGEQVTIIALGLTGQETAADLQRLAELFETREALRKALRTEPGLSGFTRVYLGGMMVGGFSGGDGLTYWAQRLHAAGWRPGMTAEDAGRLLAEVRDAR